MNTHYHTPDLTRRVFARTNHQTIDQRVAILRELLPSVSSIADICCGDCTRQREIYLQTLNLESYRGLDIFPEIVEANQAKGVECVCGDALDISPVSPASKTTGRAPLCPLWPAANQREVQD
jgi:hypothetical protein